MQTLLALTTTIVTCEAVSMPIIVLPQIIDPCLECGLESDYGVHGIKNGEASSRYYCHKCYHANKRGKEST
jgi:hypothetical protein